MPKNDELRKHTLHLYAGDYAKLQEYYHEVGAALVVRKLVRKHLEALDKNAKADTPKIDVAV